MIKIYVKGELLDMDGNATITYKSDSVLYEDAVERGEYSYPFKFPLTAHNIRLLGNIQEVNFIDDSIKIEITWLYMGAIRPALLYIDRVTYDFNSNYGICEGNIVGVEGLFYSFIKDKKIRDVNLGEPFAIAQYTIPTPSGPTLLPSVTRMATDIVNGVITDKPFVFPMMISTKNAEYWSANGISPILTQNYLARAYGIINIYRNQVVFEYPDIYSGTNDFIEVDGSDYQRANQMVPMFYNWWILEKVITALGYTISGEIFDDVDFRKTILTNNFCINKWDHISSIVTVIDRATEIDPHNHVGDLLIEDYLNDLCVIFGGVFEFDLLSKSIQFNKKKSYLTQTDYVTVDKKDIGSSIVKENVEARGLSFSYAFPNDDFVQEYLGFFAPGDVSGEVDHYANLASLSVPVDSIYYVRSRNAFYKQSKTNEWTYIGYNLNDYTGENAETITVSLSPGVNFDFKEDKDFTIIHSLPVINDNISVYGQKFYAGAGDISTTVFTDDKRYPCTPKIFYYFGLQKTNDGTRSYPYATASNYSIDETSITKLAEYSLGWHGTEGIVETSYAEWAAFMASKVKYTFTLFVNDIKAKSLTLFKIVTMLGQKFILRSTKVKVPYNGIIEAEAYKL